MTISFDDRNTKDRGNILLSYGPAEDIKAHNSGHEFLGVTADEKGSEVHVFGMAPCNPSSDKRLMNFSAACQYVTCRDEIGRSFKITFNSNVSENSILEIAANSWGLINDWSDVFAAIRKIEKDRCSLLLLVETLKKIGFSES